jgi:alkanesulfonate monooxygenase SsuD/methylene tetrahydromethanopterin reductase-like flavin-dependent oxidoreductase (luciferase family)
VCTPAKNHGGTDVLKTWIFEFFNSFQHLGAEQFDPAGCAEDYAWYFERWLRAEAMGFEGIFFSEHHFVPGRFSPSPNLLIAAVAARTKRLRLGAMGNVVPLYEPWRLAEEFAMLDQLSGGRLEIGLASGSGPREHLAVGISAEEVRPRFDEALSIIEAALTQSRVTHQGKFWQLNELAIVPRPLQQPAPPRWMIGIGVPAALSAAARGYRFCTGFLPTAQVAELFVEYRKASLAAGFAVERSHLALRRMVVLHEDTVEAHRLGEAALEGMWRYLRSPGPKAGASSEAGAVADAPQPRRGGPVVGPEECIAGNPQDVATQIAAQCSACGAGHFLAYAPNTLTRAQAGASFALWTEVNALLQREALRA